MSNLVSRFAGLEAFEGIALRAIYVGVESTSGRLRSRTFLKGYFEQSGRFLIRGKGDQNHPGN
jgi:hypothetical protein